MIKLGSRVKDKISGFTGIATARTEYIYGCARVVVDSEETDNDGKVKDGKYFDEQQLEVVEENVITKKDVEEMEKEIERKINESVEFADKSPEPSLEALHKDLYV